MSLSASTGKAIRARSTDAAAHTDEGVIDFPETAVTLYRAAFGKRGFATHEMPLSRSRRNLCYDYLEQEYGGWENNDGAFGEFALPCRGTAHRARIQRAFHRHIHSSHTF